MPPVTPGNGPGRKIPNFSRHLNVSPEQQIGPPVRLIGNIGTSNAFDIAAKQYALKEEKGNSAGVDNKWIPLYDKVGRHNGWGWREFKETPYEVIKWYNSEIDRRLESVLPKTLSSAGGSKEGNEFLSWELLYLLIALGKLFGGED